MQANELRRAFTEFFASRGHTAVPSSPLIPHHPAAPLFTNAGMNQFLPYILGEELAPHRRATSVQKCVRIMGKHDDIDNIGLSAHHLTFFEMLGNFSFGDYFKSEAIPMAWELVTEVLGYPGDRIWVTVHDSDEEAATIWREAVGLPPNRIQALGADNFWEMGETGPCGPCSELFLDKGPEYGHGGGPRDGAEERFLEFWNLVFMQYQRQPDGTLVELPRKIIDTGAGLERNLLLLNNMDSVFEVDSVAPLVRAAGVATGRQAGSDDRTDVSLRIIGDHARSATFLISDGVFPSNEDRGYVLRRIIRRAVRRAWQMGVERLVMPAMVEAVVTDMGDAYPELERNAEFIALVVTREEESFRQTLRAGSVMLDDALAVGSVTGDVAFRLHDTYGFPVELTEEIAGERGIGVDRSGFDEAMEAQRQRARGARRGGPAEAGHAAAYRQLLEQFGRTEFTGYSEVASDGHVLAVLPAGDGRVEIFLDRTPFYAEGGGQVGDTGTIATDSGRAEVLDTTAALPGLHRHVARVVDGDIRPGQAARAAIDDERRDAIRRNHTGTHLLHWALREVLGPHVKQQGSLVSPEYLRFDFSHFGPVSADELRRVEDLVNGRVLADEAVSAREMPKAEAERQGAIAMFGEKYGEVVRVIDAGHRSREFCGGTHVEALGQIGTVTVTSESSIGSNTRRLFALTGTATIALLREREAAASRLAALLRTTVDDMPGAVQRLLDRQKELQDELRAAKAQGAREGAGALVSGAVDGVVVARADGLDGEQLKELAIAVRDAGPIRAVVLIGSPDGARVALVAVVAKDSGLDASELVGPAARIVGGGGGKQRDVAVAGGRDASRIDEALAAARAQLGLS